MLLYDIPRPQWVEVKWLHMEAEVRKNKSPNYFINSSWPSVTYIHWKQDTDFPSDT